MRIIVDQGLRHRIAASGAVPELLYATINLALTFSDVRYTLVMQCC